MHSWCFRSALDAVRRDVVCPSEYKRDRKTDQQKHNHEPQTPIRQFPCWKRCRCDLNQKSCGDDISRGDTINLSSLQLLEEAAHDIDEPNFTTISYPVCDRQIPGQKRCAVLNQSWQWL